MNTNKTVIIMWKTKKKIPSYFFTVASTRRYLAALAGINNENDGEHNLFISLFPYMYIISIFLTIHSLFKTFLCNLLRENPCGDMSIKNHIQRKGAKKVSFTAYHWGKLLVVCTSPRVFSTSPKMFSKVSICYSSSVI